MCLHLEISRSGFYAWLKRPLSKRAEERTKIGFAMKNLHQTSRGLYGSPRLQQGLKNAGIKCSRNRVISIMKELNICSKIRRRYKATTNSNHKLPVAENLLARKFNPQSTNQVWASDITYIATDEGWLYVAVVMDLYSRKVVGWSMADHMRTDLVLGALTPALGARKVRQGLIHHSDRGVQYASHSYQAKLAENGIVCSMSKKGDCYDNAVVESFFHTLKTELVYLQRFETRAQAKQAIFDYIEVFYNRQRLHSTIGFLSPVQYEAVA